ncbi:Hsp70 family protein [Myxosarcina sp. GI1]|uniref:Hsp70 family protein n=1 Tax=Myxosarcina sp. GI1 TaxID=1541065 RepID=UPI00055E5051|nr:Hsp70 family protein [Myxosarcina sp. GI1]
MGSNSISTSFYAIDFGTSNTAIARWNAATEQAEMVDLGELSQSITKLPPLIPSLVYVEDASQERVVVGQTVRDRGLDMVNEPRFFRSFKRGIGSPIQGFLPQLDQKTLSFEQIGAWFLHKLIVQLQDNTETIQSLVLTVPVDSFEAYRHWLTGVFESLAVEQIRILDEPTAAALGYDATDKELLLVVDFGGGTLDLSLVRLAENPQPQGFKLNWQRIWGNDKPQKPLARVLAKAGQNLGGSDIDRWLVDYFYSTQGLPKTSLIERLAERLKIKLSSQSSASEVYFNDETLESYELNLDRDRFEDILRQQQFFERLDESMEQVIQQARRNGIEVEDIDGVLLVGGSVQIPAVRSWISKYFDENKLFGDCPYEAIVKGALQVAKNNEVKDFLYHSYGIRYWNRRQNCHSWHSIINTGQPYPLERPVELILGASTDNQTSLELIIGELGSTTSATEVYFDGERLVTRAAKPDTATVLPLNDRDGARTIAKLEPPGNPGSDRLKIVFEVDEGRYLRISVEDLLTQQTLLNHHIVARLK